MDMLVKELKSEFDNSMKTLGVLLERTEKEWESGNTPIWNHFFHALMGVEFWMRTDFEKNFSFSLRLPEEFSGLYEEKWYPRGYAAPSPETAKEYYGIIVAQSEKYFAQMTDAKLVEMPKKEWKMTYLGIICGQIRHLMCHAGMCAAELEAGGHDELPWIGY